MLIPIALLCAILLALLVLMAPKARPFVESFALGLLVVWLVLQFVAR